MKRSEKVVSLQLFKGSMIIEYSNSFNLEKFFIRSLMAVAEFEVTGSTDRYSAMKVNPGAVVRRRGLQFFDSADWAMEANTNDTGKRLSANAKTVSAIRELQDYIENAHMSSRRDSLLGMENQE
jgi:hypothetical protein